MNEEGEKRGRLTANDDILGPVQNLDSPVCMPNSQIARVQDTTQEELPRRLNILVVSLSTNVTNENDLSDFLAVTLDIGNGSLGNIGLDHPHRQTGQEAVALASHLLVLLVGWEVIPRGHVVTLGDRAVCFGHTIDVDGVQVQAGHLLEEMGCRWAGSHSDAHWLREFFGFIGVAEQRVDSRGSVEMAYLLLL